MLRAEITRNEMPYLRPYMKLARESMKTREIDDEKSAKLGKRDEGARHGQW